MKDRVNLTINNKALYLTLCEIKERNGLSLSSQITMDLLNLYYEKYPDIINEKKKEIENKNKKTKK